MSDFEDELDDDLELEEYFYVEDTYDEVGDIAEHAVASPPPFDDGEDMWDWDRFAYWNDIEYDSDGYHDVDTERIAKRKRKRVQPPPKGKLKRRLDLVESSPAKRRKGRAGASHALQAEYELPEILVSPVGWKEGHDEANAPVREVQEEPFALLKDWRAQFPERERMDGEDGADHGTEAGHHRHVDGDPEPLQIGQEAILAALRANLGKLTGDAEAGALGADEELLMQHITQMLSEEGASMDDIAGNLADALFAPDNESVASDALQEKRGDGDFGQWVLKQAEEQAGPSAAQQGSRELSPPVDGAFEHPTKIAQTPAQAVPADRRPPTPASAGSSGSSQKQSNPPPGPAPDTEPSAPRSRKRKAASTTDGETDLGGLSKRSATRSFDAPTASSRAKSAQAVHKEKPAGKMATRKASKAAKK